MLYSGTDTYSDIITVSLPKVNYLKILKKLKNDTWSQRSKNDKIYASDIIINSFDYHKSSL